jgi:hydrogenase-4 component F
MGILAIGIGLGGAGIYGSLLHVINNAFTKGFVFLLTGNLYKQYHSKKVNEVKGVLRRYPITGFFLLAGLLAVSGVPPFGTFISELMILSAAVTGHHYVVAFFYCLFLGFIFIGVSDIVLKMIQGSPEDQPASGPAKESLSMILPILFLIGIVFILGFYVPPFLDNMLQKAAGLLGG